MTKTIIHSNGSKWAGETPDSIEKLIEVLGAYDLNLRDFSRNGFLSFINDNGYGNRDYEEHEVNLFGNFNKISHVFNINGTYKTLRPVIDAIDANIAKQCDRIK